MEDNLTKFDLLAHDLAVGDKVRIGESWFTIARYTGNLNDTITIHLWNEGATVEHREEVDLTLPKDLPVTIWR